MCKRKSAMRRRIYRYELCSVRTMKGKKRNVVAGKRVEAAGKEEGEVRIL